MICVDMETLFWKSSGPVISLSYKINIEDYFSILQFRRVLILSGREIIGSVGFQDIPLDNGKSSSIYKI